MEQQKVDMFIMTNSSSLPTQQIPFIREKLLAMDDSKWLTLSTIKFKNPFVALMLSIFLGCYGADRFYLEETSKGAGKLLTCGGLGIWTIVDWFLISDATKEYNFAKLTNYLLY